MTYGLLNAPASQEKTTPENQNDLIEFITSELKTFVIIDSGVTTKDTNLTQRAVTILTPAEKFAQYKKTADKGNRESQYYIAQCYRKGFGVQKDIEKAHHYYKLAADAGNPHAQFDLAGLYQTYDFNKTDKEIEHYYALAAVQGVERQSTWDRFCEAFSKTSVTFRYF